MKFKVFFCQTFLMSTALVVDMRQLQMFQKVEYVGGPIFKVVSVKKC